MRIDVVEKINILVQDLEIAMDFDEYEFALLGALP
jgi:hypothetical protein